jgi:hypothetical protein
VNFAQVVRFEFQRCVGLRGELYRGLWFP